MPQSQGSIFVAKVHSPRELGPFKGSWVAHCVGGVQGRDFRESRSHAYIMRVVDSGFW